MLLVEWRTGLFTGIVEARPGFVRVSAERILAGTKLGDSIAIGGVDLTVTRLDAAEMCFDVMPETYRCTNLSRLVPSHRVNLERSVRSEDRLSGHVVRGVVEGTGTLVARRDDGNAVIMTYSAPETLLQQIIARGPICIDGVSLTVIAKTESTFSVSLVKFTQQHTTSLEREIGDSVNLETDIMLRYIAQLLQARGVLPSDGAEADAPIDTVAAWQAYKADR